MRDLTRYFKNRTIDSVKLIEYGFVKKENSYIYEKEFFNNQFNLIVEITEERKRSKIIDLCWNEEYTLVDVKNISGDFIGKIKEEYDDLLHDLVENCTISEVFKNKQTKEVIQYIREKYCDELEFLWEKFTNNAVWRNKVNNKWYGIVLVIPESKLGIDSNREVEILDLRYQKELIENIIDHERIFAGYHMNKKSWITIRLDGSVKIEDIYQLIDNSYECSLKK